MYTTLFEYYVAITMVTVIVVFFTWVYWSQEGATARRIKRMMRHVGLNPKVGARGETQPSAIMKQARRRCRKCRVEDFCERWLAGEAEGSNAFCPNAGVFRLLKETGGQAV